MKKYSKYTVEDFTTDSEFLDWINYPSLELDEYWTDVIEHHPSQKIKIEEAASLINSLKDIPEFVSQEKIDKLWEKIQDETNQKRILNLTPFMKWAAVFILLIGVSTVLFQLLQSPDYEFSDLDHTPISEAKIILSDGSSTLIDKEESAIEIKQSGEVIINNDTLTTSFHQLKKNKLNHVVMPYGKQSSLILPDGTKVFINAGSRISFPSSFSESKREVYLVGEAFFKVEENKQKPFIVHTADMNVLVTGTEFNVSAYNDDSFTQAVLVEGEVIVSKNSLLSSKQKIKPGESALFNKESGDVLTEMVDTDQYTSWIHSYIICKNNAVADVIKKVERYYNRKITIEEEVPELSFSGKLDLNENIESVLEAITFASSLNLEFKDDEIRILR